MDCYIYRESKRLSFLNEVNERIRSYQGRVQENRLAHDVLVIHHDAEADLVSVCNRMEEALSQSLIKWNVIRLAETREESDIPEIFRFLELNRIFRKARALGAYPGKRLISWIVASGSACVAATALCLICLMVFPKMHLESAVLSPVFLLNASWLSPLAAWGAVDMLEKRESRNRAAQKKLASLLTNTGSADLKEKLVTAASNQLFYSPLPIAFIVPRLSLIDDFSKNVLRSFLKDTEKQDLFMVRTLWVMFEQAGQADVSKLLAEVRILGSQWKGTVSPYRLRAPSEKMGKAA